LLATRRREILKLLAGAAAWPLLHRDALAAISAVHVQLASKYQGKALDPHQNAIVETIAEIIIPETHTPGAKSARVTEFIDVILADWADDAERQRFLDGLVEVDRRSQDLFAKEFAALSSAQQSEIVRGFDDEFMVDVVDQAGRPSDKNEPMFKRSSFFAMMKRLTLIGYYTSAVGSRALHYQIVPSSHIQCAPIEPQEAD
jgi:gluconate 2-dehydrogenase gamma chain